MANWLITSGSTQPAIALGSSLLSLQARRVSCIIQHNGTQRTHAESALCNWNITCVLCTLAAANLYMMFVCLCAPPCFEFILSAHERGNWWQNSLRAVYLCGVLADGIMHAQFQRSNISPSAMCTRSRGRSTRFFNFFVRELNLFIRAHWGSTFLIHSKGEAIFKMHQLVNSHTRIWYSFVPKCSWPTA